MTAEVRIATNPLDDSALAVEGATAIAGRLRESRPVSICLVGLSNLAVLAPDVDKGGAAGEPVQQTLLAKALVKHGFKVSMVTADHGQPDGAMFDGVRVYKAFAPNAGLPIARFFHPRWTGLWAAMKRADADVYYFSCAGAMVGQIAMFCRVHAKRFVFRIVSDADCAIDTLVIKHWYWRDSRMYAYGLRRADAVLAQTEYQRELLKKNFGVESSLAPLIADPPEEVGPYSMRDIDVLWVNNVRQLKRPDLFLRLADQLPQLRFHVIGGPVPGERGFYESMRAEMTRRSNITFHGPVPYQHVNGFYSRARVLINTSDIEGFPNSYLQAWMRGTPVVAFFDPDDLIRKQRLGCAAKSLEEMRQALHELATSEIAWSSASARARKFMNDRFSEEAMLRPYVQAIVANNEEQP